MTVPMKLSDTELPVQDREWIERVLGADEQLLLVQKPMTSLWKPGYAYRMFFALLWNGTLSLAFLGIVSHWNNAAVRLPLLVCLLLLLPFVLVGVGFLISPWWERSLDRRTVYVLTDKRALVLRPSTFRRRPVARSYPLAHDLIKEVREYGRGCGDIVMEQFWAHGGHCIPLGFLFVQNVRELEYAIHTHLPDAPPKVQEPETAPPERPTLWSLLPALVILFFAARELMARLNLAADPELFKDSNAGGQSLAVILILSLICYFCISSLVRKGICWVKSRKN